MVGESNRGPWIVALAIILAAGLVVGAWAYFREQDQTCAEWQAEYRSTLQTLARDAFARGIDTPEEIEGDPAIYNASRDLAERNPGGCPAPDVDFG